MTCRVIQSEIILHFYDARLVRVSQELSIRPQPEVPSSVRLLASDDISMVFVDLIKD